MATRQGEHSVGKRRAAKKWEGVDPAAAALLQVNAIQAVLQRGGDLPRSWRSWRATPEFTGEWLGRSGILALALYEQTIRAGMAPNAKTSEKQLAVKVAENVLDRVAGKPTERVQHTGGVTVIFESGKHGGIDPDRLPGTGTVNGRGDLGRSPNPVPLLPPAQQSRSQSRPGSGRSGPEDSTTS